MTANAKPSLKKVGVHQGLEDKDNCERFLGKEGLDSRRGARALQERFGVCQGINMGYSIPEGGVSQTLAERKQS